MDIVATDVNTLTVERDYLPDNVVTYENILEFEISTVIYIFVTNQLDSITESDFERLKASWEAYTSKSRGIITFVQVNKEKLGEVNKTKFRNSKITLDNIYKSYVRVSDISEFSFKYVH